MTNEIELSDEQLAVVTGGGDRTSIRQKARGSLRQSNRSEANTIVRLNANHSEGDITFEVMGASVGQGNIGVVSTSNG